MRQLGVGQNLGVEISWQPGEPCNTTNPITDAERKIDTDFDIVASSGIVYSDNGQLARCSLGQKLK